MPVFARTRSFASAAVSFPIQAAAIALVITPSLAYMAEAVSSAGLGSFGVAYGLYNVAWGIGLLAGPAIGGGLFVRVRVSGGLSVGGRPVRRAGSLLVPGGAT